MRLSVLCLGALCAVSAERDDHRFQASADSVLNRAIAAYADVRTLRASFTQSVRDPMLGDAVTRGELMQERPNKFVMRWTEPRGDMLLADGQWLWIYLPSSAPNQVVKSAITGRAGTSPDIINEFLDRPRERFTIALLRSEAVGGRPADVLSLTPRQRTLPYSRVLAWVDRRDGLVRQVEITEASGMVRRITMDRLQVNPALPAGTFTFRPPTGARVVDASH